MIHNINIIYIFAQCKINKSLNLDSVCETLHLPEELSNLVIIQNVLLDFNRLIFAEILKKRHILPTSSDDLKK